MERESNGRFPSNLCPQGAQGILEKSSQEDCKNQSEWGTLGLLDALNQMSKVHLNSQSLEQQAQCLHKFAPGLQNIYF